jgi:hypothetical protein
MFSFKKCSQLFGAIHSSPIPTVQYIDDLILRAKAGDESSACLLYKVAKKEEPSYTAPVKASTTIGSGENGVVTIESDVEGEFANNFTIEVTHEEGEVPLSATLTDEDILVTLSTIDNKIAQQERITITGTYTGDGTVTFTVDGEHITDAPKTYDVVISGSVTTSDIINDFYSQISVDTDVTDEYIVTKLNNTLTLEDKTERTNDATLNISFDGITPTGFTNIPNSDNGTSGADPIIGVTQQEKITLTGTYSGDDTVTFTVVGTHLLTSPKTYDVVLSGSVTTSDLIDSLYAQISIDIDVTTAYDVTKLTNTLTLTDKTERDSDATLNIAFDAGTSGFDDVTSSEDLRTGVTPFAGTEQTESITFLGTYSHAGTITLTVTGAHITTSPVTYEVVLSSTTTTSDVATAFETLLLADTDITGEYDVSALTDTLTLTDKTPRVSDATLNMAFHGGGTGFDSVVNSEDLREGDGSSLNTATLVAEAINGIVGKTFTATASGTGNTAITLDVEKKNFTGGVDGVFSDERRAWEFARDSLSVLFE